MTHKLLIWSRVSGRYFLENEQSKPIRSRETNDKIYPKDKIQTFKWKLKFWILENLNLFLWLLAAS